MNNISRDLNTNNNGYAIKSGHGAKNAPVNAAADASSTNRNCDESVKATLDYIGMVNFAKVNNPKNIHTQRAVAEFLENPELIEEKIAFQDELMQRGYQPADAMEKTEIFFKALKDRHTYND